ncbi:MAG TPA: peptide deformylase [Anaerolineales bacterium]|nr:peptide deformylase [Anaerolineales bacterium]
MGVREIITPPNPVLRQRARKVRAFTPGLQQLIEDMIETMRVAPGVGLAAPQVAVSQQVIVVEYAEEEDDHPNPPQLPKLYVIVNPEIIRRSKEMISGAEGCLSVPGFLGEVERHQAVTVKGVDRRGKPLRIKADGWLARILQHEIDHLEGILFIDRASKVWRAEESQVEAPVPV